MLILHRSLHILVSHRSHDGSQVSGSLQNPGAVIMSATIQDKIFGKPSLDSGFAKSLRHCGEMSRLGALRWENPSFAFFSAPLFKNGKDAIAHRYASPSFFGLLPVRATQPCDEQIANRACKTHSCTASAAPAASSKSPYRKCPGGTHLWTHAAALRRLICDRALSPRHPLGVVV